MVRDQDEELRVTNGLEPIRRGMCQSGIPAGWCIPIASQTCIDPPVDLLLELLVASEPTQEDRPLHGLVSLEQTHPKDEAQNKQIHTRNPFSQNRYYLFLLSSSLPSEI